MENYLCSSFLLVLLSCFVTLVSPRHDSLRQKAGGLSRDTVLLDSRFAVEVERLALECVWSRKVEVTSEAVRVFCAEPRICRLSKPTLPFFYSASLRVQVERVWRAPVKGHVLRTYTPNPSPIILLTTSIIISTFYQSGIDVYYEQNPDLPMYY